MIEWEIAITDIPGTHIAWRATLPIGTGALELVVGTRRQVMRLSVGPSDFAMGSACCEKHALRHWFEVIKGVAGSELGDQSVCPGLQMLTVFYHRFLTCGVGMYPLIPFPVHILIPTDGDVSWTKKTK
jgi:hypothetical protein